MSIDGLLMYSGGLLVCSGMVEGNKCYKKSVIGPGVGNQVNRPRSRSDAHGCFYRVSKLLSCLVFIRLGFPFFFFFSFFRWVSLVRFWGCSAG